MAASAPQFGVVTGLLAVLAAVFSPFGLRRDLALTRGMGALRSIVRHTGLQYDDYTPLSDVQCTTMRPVGPPEGGHNEWSGAKAGGGTGRERT